MPNSPFTVAGMSSTSGTSHTHGSPWGGASTSGTLGTSLSESYGQPKTHYQSGYMMASAQTNALPQGSQRVDEVPTVQTKAKLNHALSRSDFGMESMFEKSSRQRQSLADEDAPPMTSVYDIPNENYMDTGSARYHPRNSVAESPRTLQLNSSTSPSDIHYVVVFGYPADKYTVTVEYFKSIGETTDPDPNMQITNCFRIGYKDLGEAMRAVKRNGETLSGSYMVGAKWADLTRANDILVAGRAIGPSDMAVAPMSPNAMAVDDTHASQLYSNTPTYGTPIKLAPSAAAFRKPGQSPMHNQSKGTMGPPAPASLPNALPAGQSHGGKSMLGQVSDMIFGW